jgi:hypothetical protein
MMPDDASDPNLIQKIEDRAGRVIDDLCFTPHTIDE